MVSWFRGFNRSFGWVLVNLVIFDFPGQAGTDR